MEGVGQHLGLRLEAGRGKQIDALPVIRGVAHDGLVHAVDGEIHVESGAALGHKRRNSRDAGIDPLHEGLEVGGLVDRGCREGQASGRVVLGQQMDNALRALDQIGGQHILCGDVVGHQSPGQVFAGLLQHIVGIAHDHADKALKFIGGRKRAIKLIAEDGIAFLEHVFAIEVGLEDVGDSDLLLIHGLAIRQLDAVVLLKILVGNVELADMVAVALAIHHHAAKLRGIGADAENGAAEHLGHGAHNGIVAGFKHGLGLGDKGRGVHGGGNLRARGLRMDCVQNGCDLVETHFICCHCFHSLTGGAMIAARISSADCWAGCWVLPMFAALICPEMIPSCFKISAD